MLLSTAVSEVRGQQSVEVKGTVIIREGAETWKKEGFVYKHIN
jgi:hypothetical protein